jgi:hypothetical protein
VSSEVRRIPHSNMIGHRDIHQAIVLFLSSAKFKGKFDHSTDGVG